MRYSLGIDIGGTTVASGIVNQNGDLIQQVIQDSDPSEREQMFASVVQSVEKLLSHSSIPLDQIYGIGVGVPGKVDRENGVAIYQNNLPWKNFPIVDRLKKEFNISRIVMDNDVYMAAFSEWKEAKLTDELFVYLTLSTGISCSIIQEGEFIRGAGFAGELGLVPVHAPHDDVLIDRLEKVASGPAMTKYGRVKLGDNTLTSEKVFQQYYEGDKLAQQLVENVASSIAHGIYMIVSIIDPHKIVLGGSVAVHNRILLTLIKDKLTEYLIAEQQHILDHMEISTQGNEQGIIGAGLRVFHSFPNS